MTTVTIPKELAKKGDLVLVPRKEYERLQRAAFSYQSPKKKKKSALDRGLEIALREVREGKTFGPFNTAEELIQHVKKQ